jgi:hypothetical protein
MRHFDRRFSCARIVAFVVFICAFALGVFLLSSMGDTTAFGEPRQEDTVPEDEAPEKIAVTGIEIGDHKQKMTTGETQELAAGVLPSDATTQTINYSSSDTTVATVSSKGQVKALAAGTVTIQMRADEVVREIAIEVTIATKAIEASPNFLVLAPGDSAALKVSVVPHDAPQSVSFKAGGTAVADVSAAGVVQAKSPGATSIVVSNGDASAAVTVLVNGRTQLSDDAASEQNDEEPTAQGTSGALTEAEVALIIKIEAEGGTLHVRQSDVPTVSKAVLKALRVHAAMLVVTADAYTLSIKGEDIQNEQNELFTHVPFETNGDDIVFKLNFGRNLPGLIEIELREQGLDRNYLYLFNTSKDTYQELASKTDTVLVLDEAGSYRLSDERLDKLTISPLWAIAALAVVLVGVIVFVIVKRRYWFW